MSCHKLSFGPCYGIEPLKMNNIFTNCHHWGRTVSQRLVLQSIYLEQCLYTFSKLDKSCFLSLVWGSMSSYGTFTLQGLSTCQHRPPFVMQVLPIICVVNEWLADRWNSLTRKLYSVTPKPDRRIFVNNEKVNKKYQFLMVRLSKVVHPTRYGEV